MNSQRAFNLPPVITSLIGSLVGIHLFMELLRTNAPEIFLSLRLMFSFIPIRYSDFALATKELPGAEPAAIWSFLSYGFLHADITHLIFNALWLSIFGSALARRFGTIRFLIFISIGIITGAAAHLFLYFNSLSPVVGISAGVTACIAGVIRFAFEPGAPLGSLGQNDYYRPARPFSEVIKNRNALVMMAVFIGLDVLFGTGSFLSGNDITNVAWAAHLGGFIAGLAIFPLLDPVPPHQNTPWPPRRKQY